jgi:hypothetical protein
VTPVSEFKVTRSKDQTQNTAGIEPKTRISKQNTSSNTVPQVQYKGEGQRVKEAWAVLSL